MFFREAVRVTMHSAPGFLPRVWCRVWGVGFGVWDLRFGVWGLGFEVGFGVTEIGHPISRAAARWVFAALPDDRNAGC
jgi:hypothetical protein